MKVQIINNSETPAPKKFIQEWMDEYMSYLLKKKIIKKAASEKELTLVFLNKKAAQKLNHEFRGKDYATDVLSFDSVDPASIGELVMCPEVLKKQAKEHDLTYKHELGYMLLHGILHLLGYDHEVSEKEAKKMFKIQDEAFEKLLEQF
ncbi:Endoribonuclease YbeY [compost metagenome]